MSDLTLAICMYNAERYIEETLRSVMAQTMQDFHLLIINDCSTDKSVEIVKRFFGEHSRKYELVSLEENSGIGYARHFAERRATTHYMMFLDADDILYPDAVETMYAKMMSDPDLMAVGCYLEYIDGMGYKIGGGLFLGETSKEKFYEKAALQKLIFMQPTAIYDRELALSIGGYTIDGYPLGQPRYQDFCEDLDLWTRMSDLYVQGKAIVVVPKVLCQYRKGGGLSSHHFEMILKMRYVKQNLLRRRTGKQELSFTDFFSRLSKAEIKAYRRDALAARALHSSAIALRGKKIPMCIWELLKSLWYKPSYLPQKLLNNTSIFRKH